jgi:Fe-S oxidoreductase
MRVMAKGETKQDRLGWLTDDLSVSEEKGEVFYWTGCTVYFDTLFSDFQVETLNATRAAIGLLNRLGVTPVVSAEERGCGHDLLWNGDRQSFELLAKHNTNLVAESGASLLLTSCAECLRTWRLDYEPFFEGKPPRIQHISEYLCEHLSELAPKSNGHPRVTYQDPCRLGRHLGVYEPPRKLLSTLGIELVEMPRKGSGAICCAGGTWSNCDRFAKSIQVDRLREARGTGATVLATACPKCQIHFRCAMKDPKLGKEISIETLDLAELVLAQTCSDQSTTEKEEGKEVSP